MFRTTLNSGRREAKEDNGGKAGSRALSNFANQRLLLFRLAMNAPLLLLLLCGLGLTLAQPPPARHVLENGQIYAAFGQRGLVQIEPARRRAGMSPLTVAHDDFALTLSALPYSPSAKSTVVSSAAATALPTLRANGSAVTVNWQFKKEQLAVTVVYRLVSDGAAFVEKQLLITNTGAQGVLLLLLLPPPPPPPPLLLIAVRSRAGAARNVTSISLFDGTSLQASDGQKLHLPSSSLTASSHYGLGDYAVFQVLPDPACV